MTTETHTKPYPEIVRGAVTHQALAGYLSAENGARIGIYIDGTFVIGPDVGHEILEDDLPITCVACPGIENLDTRCYTDGFVTYNHITGLYDSIEQDRTQCVETYTLTEVIWECCTNGNVEVELKELTDLLIANLVHSAIQPEALTPSIEDSDKDLLAKAIITNWCDQFG